MPGSERKPAAKEVDAVFSTAAMVEKRGSGGEGGERRQRAMDIRDNRIDGRLGSGDGGSVRTQRRDQWRETATTRPWRQQRTASEEKDVTNNVGRGRKGDGGEEAVRKQGKKRRWLGLCGIEKETEKKEEAKVDGCNGELGSRDQRVDEDGDKVDGDGEE